MTSKHEALKEKARKAFMPLKSMVKRPGKGALKWDYLVPSGYYQEQWDWDAFFIGIALSSELPSEAIYLKNWTRNYVELADKKGKVPGCVTPAGADPRLNHMKPFIGQGTYAACVKLNEWDWVKPLWSKIKLIVAYREKTMWSKEYGLAMWNDNMESGADNDLTVLGYPPFPPATIINPDVNSFLVREYTCLSLLAKKISTAAEAKMFKEKAEKLKKNLNKHLWDDQESMYVSIDTRTNTPIKKATYTAIVPIFLGMAPQAKGEAFIKKYMLSKKEMMSNYGIRTLTVKDERYNNANIIKPHSNWQGPVWPLVNWMCMQGLLAYGFQKEAIDLAVTITKLVLADIEKTGGMHEDYDAETGEGLAAPMFISWNLLVGNMIEEAETNFNPLEL